MSYSRNLLRAFAIQMIAIYKETNRKQMKDEIEKWDHEVWMVLDPTIIPNEFKELQEYKIAEEILNSPLYKSLKEEENE